MAYSKSVNTDQLFVRELVFKDFGNRSISSGQVLVARGDGNTYFSNVSTSGLYSFSGVQAGNLSTINATTMSTTLYLGAGPGISYTVSSNIGNSQRIFVNNLGIQQLGVYDDNSIINFSSLSVPTPAGRTLWMKGEGEVYVRTSTNTVVIGSAFTSSYSSILYLESTMNELIDEVSTNLVYASTVLGIFIANQSTTNLSSLTADITGLSTFVYTTFKDDGTGHHNNLVVSTISTNYLNASTIFGSNSRWDRADGRTLTLSTLDVSTICGIAAPILTFDKTNYRVGVNLSNLMPLATLDVGGEVYATNFINSSDRRLKHDISILPLPAYISSYQYIYNGLPDIGVLADEVEPIAPSCVYTRPDGYKGVSYPKLVPILLSYIHDLNRRLTAIERKM